MAHVQRSSLASHALPPTQPDSTQASMSLQLVDVSCELTTIEPRQNGVPLYIGGWIEHRISDRIHKRSARMRSSLRATVWDRALRLTIAVALVLGSVSTSLAVGALSSSTCNATGSGEMQRGMACCCPSGMSRCQMPKKATLCNCKAPDDSIKSVPATVPNLSSFELPAADIPANEVPDWNESAIDPSMQRSSWECDLPPPESHFGYLPNRAPPSL
jgi:hypothetical protein